MQMAVTEGVLVDGVGGASLRFQFIDIIWQLDQRKSSIFNDAMPQFHMFLKERS